MTRKINRISQPKTKAEFKQVNDQLHREGYVPMPVHKNGETKAPSLWESMVSSVGYGDMGGKNGGGTFIASSSKEQPMPEKGTKTLGWMTWGDDNKLPNNIAALVGMLPYTATGWKFNTDVTAGLGPRPKYRYTQHTPGIGIETKEIDYEAAGMLIKERINDLRKQYIALGEGSEDTDGETNSSESSLDEGIKPMGNGSVQSSSDDTADMIAEMKSDLREQIEDLKKDYDTWKKTNEEVKEFLRNTDMNLLYLNEGADFHMTGMCFPELQLSSDLDTDTAVWKPRVTGLGVYSCWVTRLERRDENGRINYVYLSNKWLEGKKADDKDISVLPALDETCAAKQLEEQIIDIRTSNKLKPRQRPTRFVLPVKYPSPGKAYYPQPSWHSIFCGSIYEYASTIISDRATRRKNSNIIGRIIYIHTDYLEKMFLQQNAQSEEEKQKIFDSIMSEINAFLRDPDNSGQSLFAYTFTGNDGKEHESYRIVEIPASNKGTADANKTELEEVCSILFFAQNIHPDLIGAVPGHSGSSGGTYQREMLLIKQLLLSPTQRILLKPFEVATAFNKWDSHLVWQVQQMALTTLDNSKTGLKETQMS